MFLRGEPGPLNLRIVELGVGVGNLHAGGEGLEPLHVAGLFRVALGQGRHVLGVVNQEGRLHQVGLHVHRQHLVDETTARLPRPGHQAQFGALAGQRLRVRVVLDVHAAAALQLLTQRQAGPRRREIDHIVAHRDLHGAVYVLSQRRNQRFHHLHDGVVVGVGFVGFQQGELRVVVLVNSLVAENAADLIDLIETADDQALEVQLGGNAQV